MRRVAVLRKFISCDDRPKTLPQGSALLIRTGNNKVYQLKTKIDLQNKLVTSATYGSITSWNANKSAVTGIAEGVTGIHTGYTNFYAEFHIPDDALEDILQYGIVKIRDEVCSQHVTLGELIQFKHDYIFSGKRFEKLHDALSNSILSMKKYYEDNPRLIETLKNWNQNKEDSKEEQKEEMGEF